MNRKLNSLLQAVSKHDLDLCVYSNKFIVDPLLKRLFHTFSDETFEEVIGLSKVTVLDFALKRMEWTATNVKTKPLSLPAITEVILFMFYLRHYLEDSILACLLHCTTGTARNTRLRMLQWFYDRLKGEIKVPKEEDRFAQAVFL